MGGWELGSGGEASCQVRGSRINLVRQIRKLSWFYHVCLIFLQVKYAIRPKDSKNCFVQSKTFCRIGMISNSPQNDRYTTAMPNFQCFFQAKVVCKQLGCSQVINMTDGSKFGSVPSNFSYDDVACLGIEADLNSCPHNNAHNCGTTEGAGVICQQFSGLKKNQKFNVLYDFVIFFYKILPLRI